MRSKELDMMHTRSKSISSVCTRVVYEATNWLQAIKITPACVITLIS